MAWCTRPGGVPVRISAFVSAFRTPDLRKKLLFTLAMIAIFRLGSVVPTPGVDFAAVDRCLTLVQDNSLLGLVQLPGGVHDLLVVQHLGGPAALVTDHAGFHQRKDLRLGQPQLGENLPAVLTDRRRRSG